MPKLSFKLFVIVALATSSGLLSAERVRLDRKHGVANAVLHEILRDKISLLKNGLGKIELSSARNIKKGCKVDLFVAPETIHTIAYDVKDKFHAEFYVDHPNNSFKNVLFQALVKDDKNDTVKLSIDTKALSYSFQRSNDSLVIEVKTKDEAFKCGFDLNDAVLISGQTE